MGEQLPLLLRTFHFTVIRVLIAALSRSLVRLWIAYLKGAFGAPFFPLML